VDKFRYRYINEIVLIIAWLCGIASVVVIVNVPPSSGYELSIYIALPILYWIFVLSSLFGFIIVAVRTSLSYSNDNKTCWIISIVGIFIIFLQLMWLPDLRGYFLKGLGDFTTHIARSEAILKSGYVDKQVFYPMSYALVQLFHVILGINPDIIWRFGGIFIYIIYVLFTFLASNSIDESSVMLSVVASVIYVSGQYLPEITPGNLSIYLMPLLILLFIKSRESNRMGFRILLVIILLIYPFLHPLTAFLLIIYLFVMETSKWLINYMRMKKFYSSYKVDLPIIEINAVLILLIAWVTWFSSFSVWNNSLIAVQKWLIGEAKTQLQIVDYLASRANFSVWDTLWLAIKQEGGVLLYGSVALLVLVWLLIRLKWNFLSLKNSSLIFSIYAVLVLAIVFSGFALVGPFGGLDIPRLLRYVVPFATLLIGFYGLNINNKERLVINFSFTSVFIIAAFSGVYTLHSSPFVLKPNNQVTAQDYKCIEWLLRYKSEYPIKGIWSVSRLVDLVIGPDERAKRVDIDSEPLPDHFGYNTYSSMARNFHEKVYFPITTFDKETTLNLWSMADKFNTEDFEKLTQDRSVLLLYTNGECGVYATHLPK